jgi:hypothetical protein
MAHYRFLNSKRLQINIPEALAAVSQLTWHSYNEKGKHWGIGLTCNEGSQNPDTDALQIRQDLNPAPHSYGQEHFQNFNAFSPAAEIFFKPFLESFKLPTTKAKLSKLLPGAIIPPHKDLGCEGIIRVHWVLGCEEENLFLFYKNNKREESITLSPGSIFAFDPNCIHGVHYRGQHQPRIHLVANYAVALDEIEDKL